MRSLDRLAEASALLRSVEQSEELTATQRHACWHIQALVDDLASSVQTLQEMDGGLPRADGGTTQPQTISEIISGLDTGHAVKIFHDTPQSDVEQGSTETVADYHRGSYPADDDVIRIVFGESLTAFCNAHERHIDMR